MPHSNDRHPVAKVLWKPKNKPIATWGRLAHALWGVGIGLGASALGLPAMAGLGISAGVGWGWEMATPYLAKKFGWDFPHPDYLDAVAFPFGTWLQFILS